LVIGYGNTLRSDDAIGVRAAEAIARRAIPGVCVDVVPQLLPEQAESIARAERVIFVDARVNDRHRGVDVQRLTMNQLDPLASVDWSHRTSASVLLHLAKHLYGRQPKGWIVSIPAWDLSHGEALSEPGSQALSQAIERIAELIEENG
jgi:hydrogenase maturation protease